MKLSILIPTFNRATFLREAIASGLEQGVRDSEIIVVDDGSTDDTPEVVKEFAGHVTYIRNENGGVAHARNTAMRAARGDYIAYLDDDDLYYPFKSQLQCRILDANPNVGMVYSEFSAFAHPNWFDEYHLKVYHESAYRRGGVSYDSLFSHSVPVAQCSYLRDIDSLPDAYLQGHSLYTGRIYDAYVMNTVVFTNSMMFRRDVLERVGYQNPRFGMFHDLEFALRICKHYDVAFVDIPTYKLRYHPQQISTLNRYDGKSIAIRRQRDLLSVARSHGLTDATYYCRRKAELDRQFARLSRAVALPLMTFSGDSKHKTRYYPRRARKYLRYSARFGYPQRLLLALTYLPPLLRRVAFKMISSTGLHRV